MKIKRYCFLIFLLILSGCSDERKLANVFDDIIDAEKCEDLLYYLDEKSHAYLDHVLELIKTVDESELYGVK